MAYMNQEKKAKIREQLKKVVPKTWKYTLAVDNYSTIVMTIKSAPVDLIEEMNRCITQHTNNSGYRYTSYADVNPYHADKQFDKSLKIIQKILDALNTDNFNESDSQTDYFHVGHYVDLNIGRYNKPFVIK